MTDRQLAAELAAARVLLAQLSTADLATLELATPPVGYWSRLLTLLLRTERLRRGQLELRTHDLIAMTPTGTAG